MAKNHKEIIKVFVGRYWACILFALMALTHFTITATTCLTPWKGGGYGMYSDYHPISYDIWIETNGRRFLVEQLLDDQERNKEFQNQIAICKAFPNEFNLATLIEFLDQKDHKPTGIEVWRSNFNMRTNEYTRVLIIKYED